jgi:hypothetical protein
MVSSERQTTNHNEAHEIDRTRNARTADKETRILEGQFRRKDEMHPAQASDVTFRANALWFLPCVRAASPERFQDRLSVDSSWCATVFCGGYVLLDGRSLPSPPECVRAALRHGRLCVPAR